MREAERSVGNETWQSRRKRASGSVAESLGLGVTVLKERVLSPVADCLQLDGSEILGLAE